MYGYARLTPYYDKKICLILSGNQQPLKKRGGTEKPNE